MLVKELSIGESFDGYRITDVVGRGGMGTVYRAWDENLDRDVALKVLPVVGLDDERDAERFQREGRLAARLQHANIVGVYGAGQADGFLYLAMEMVEGHSLRSRLRQQPGLRVEEALDIGRQVLRALVAAHDSGITHRDIKPENILLRQDGTVKILDFGVAKVQEAELLTRADEILGTVEYMAPEQILGETVDSSSDLYAVGVLLYEMATGVLPFTGDSPATLVYHQLNEEPHAPSLLNIDVSRALDHFILRLLEKLPEDRYESAREALVEVDELRRSVSLGGLPALKDDASAQAVLPRARNLQPRFCGRQSELETLTNHVAALSDGGRLLFLQGEAGVGKSHLLRELMRRVNEGGGRTITGSCFFEHQMGPYMPFFDALGHLLGSEEADHQPLHDLLAERAPELAQLTAGVSTTARIRAGFSTAFGAQTNDSVARQRLFDTLFDLFALAARDQPLVICLEDLHWADEGSIQLLQYLGRRVPEAQLLIIVTYRPEELSTEETNRHPLSELVNQLDAEGGLAQLILPRLDRPETGQLVRSLFPDSTFSDEFADYLYEQSQGNPFIAVEVVRLLRQRDVLYCESGVWSVTADFGDVLVPDRVSALIMRRIDQLDIDQRELLQMAAVAGQRFSSHLLASASGLPRMQLLKALFRLERRNGLIATIDKGYEFSHSKIREVLYAEVPAELRREYHRIVANALDEGYAQGEDIPQADLAEQLYLGGEYERAIPHLVEAGAEAFRLFGWRRAATLYDQAADACRRIDQVSDERFRALRFGAMAYVYLTAYEQTLERSAEMRQVARTAGRPADEAEAWKIVGKVDEQRRRFDAAVEDYERAFECLQDVEAPSVRSRILINWGCADFECGRYDEAQRRWSEALGMSQTDDLSEKGQCINNLAIIHCLRGNFELAWEMYEYSLALHAEAGPTPQTVLTYYNMGMLRADQERWDEALELYDRSLDVCRESHYLYHEPVIELNRTEALIGRGNLVEARKACSRALRGLRRLDDTLGLADALRLYGRICRLERNWEDCRTYLNKSIEMNQEFGSSVSLAEAHEELAMLERDLDSTGEALDHLKEAETIFLDAQAAPDLERVRSLIQSWCVEYADRA